MIALGLRLTLRGGREAAARLLVIAVAVALGVGLLLATLAGINAVHAQNDRYAWLETGAVGARPSAATGDPLWWLISADEFHGTLIGRVDLAATGPHSPVPPGIPRLPGPGQYYASPALAALLRSTPASQLADRYPGRQVGTIADRALPSPDSLIVVIGESPGELSRQPGATRVTSISTTAPNGCNGPCYDVGVNARSMDLILSVVTAALLVPIMIFIGTASRLSAARREQRFAAMRLVGATPRQIAVIATVESTVAAAIGVAAGFGVFSLVRPLLATVPFTGERFFPADLALSAADIGLVALGVPAAAAVAAWLALRRVIVSPLGVTRRVTPPAPRAWRLLPLLAGLAELTVFVVIGTPATTGGQILAYLPGIIVTLVGLVVAGPWLTMMGSRAVVRRARRPAALIAARRLADNPQAGFRAISGVVVSLFVASVAFGAITTLTYYRGGTSQASAADRATMVDELLGWFTRPVSLPVLTVPPGVRDELAAIPGVQAVTVLHSDPALAAPPGPVRGVVTCAELAALPVLGRCPGGAGAVTFGGQLGSGLLDNTGTVWPAASVPVAAVQRMPVAAVVVGTDGSAAALERTRTVLESAFGHARGYAPATFAENRAQQAETRRVQGYQRLADVVILASLPIAGCTLAVSVVAGLNDRKRPFSLLRLTGAPLGVLRRVVALETAVPLLLGAAASVGAGFLAALLFLRAQLAETLRPPSIGYYGAVVAGLVASLAIVASTLPLLERITGPETARNE